MKKILLAFAFAATMFTACREKGTNLEPVAEPTWYSDEGYSKSVISMYEDFPIWHDNVVMMGDNYIHKAPWSEFYADTTFRNRGVSAIGVEHVLWQIDGVASSKPAKIFIQIGNTDIDRGTSATEVVTGICKIFDRARKISPETKLFFISPVSRGDEGVKAAVEQVNKSMQEYAGKGIFTFVDVNSALQQGLAGGSFSPDGGYSLNGAGYEAFAAALDPYVGKTHLNRAAEEVEGEASYHKTRASVYRSIARQEGPCIMMLGASIVEGGLWNELFPFSHTCNRGISGDRTDDILDRIADIKAMSPDKIFLQVGRNDMGGKETIDVNECWSNYEKLIKELKKELLEADLYVQSVFPVGRQVEYCDQFNAAAQQLNKLLEAGVERYEYFYLDIWSVLADEQGYMKEEYSYDGVHLVADGYFRWATVLLEGGGARLMVFDKQFQNK